MSENFFYRFVDFHNYIYNNLVKLNQDNWGLMCNNRVKSLENSGSYMQKIVFLKVIFGLFRDT